MSKVKYAVYKGKIGLYALEYIDTMEGCKDLLGAKYIKQEDLPIVVNMMGGRHSFYPVEDNFVEIIEIEEGTEPLSREQCYPKNDKEFEYGWISPDGDTYNSGFEGHRDCAEMLLNELGIKDWNPERYLEEAGWIKIYKPYEFSPTEASKGIYAENLKITKKQADTLIDLGYSTHEDFMILLEVNSNRW